MADFLAWALRTLTFVAPISFPVVSVFLTGLGIVGTMLAHRGRRRMDFESRLEENRIATEEILSRIKSLPKSAPQEVKDELWLTYRMLNSMLPNQNKDRQSLPAPDFPSNMQALPNAAANPIPANPPPRDTSQEAHFN